MVKHNNMLRAYLYRQAYRDIDEERATDHRLIHADQVRQHEMNKEDARATVMGVGLEGCCAHPCQCHCTRGLPSPLVEATDVDRRLPHDRYLSSSVSLAGSVVAM